LVEKKRLMIENINILDKWFKGKFLPYALSLSDLEYDHHHEDFLKVSTQSLIEAELATHQHRWPEMRELQRKFFDNVADLIIKAEVDLLKLFKLPSFDDITDRILNDEDDPENAAVFKIDDNMLKGLKRIVTELNFAITGKEKLEKNIKSIMDMPFLTYFMFNAFTLSERQALKNIIDPNAVNQTALAAQLENNYLQGMIRDGGNRISTELALQNFEAVRAELVNIARSERSVWSAARYLHKQYGGKLWYWKRITRSELVLAANAGYRAQSEASGTQYEVWSAAANACDICAGLDGHQWKLNEGPEPCSSTHPHCCCIKYSLYLPEKDKPVNDRWDEPSPYGSGNGWNSERLENLMGRLL